MEYRLEVGEITFRAGSAVCVDETQQQGIVDIATLNVRKEESICGERNEERTSRMRPVLDPQGQERSECPCCTRNPSYSAVWPCDSQCSTSRRILLKPLCASRNRWRYCPITSRVQGAQSPQSRVRTRWLRLQPATWRRWILDETFLYRLGTSYTSAGHKSKAIFEDRQYAAANKEADGASSISEEPGGAKITGCASPKFYAH